MPSVKLTLAEASVAIQKLLIHIEAENIEDKDSAERILLMERIINVLLKAFPEVIEIPSFVEEDLEHIRPWVEDAKKLVGKQD